MLREGSSLQPPAHLVLLVRMKQGEAVREQGGYLTLTRYDLNAGFHQPLEKVPGSTAENSKVQPLW